LGKKEIDMKILVTGGGGFLGAAIIRQLVARGNDVISYSRRRYAVLDDLGVNQFQGDLLDIEKLRQAMRGCEAVFHVAAKVGMWGKYEDFFQNNVKGTENVIRACKNLGIRYLIFTSSPSVVFDGKDCEGKNESLPYPKKYSAFYPQTKAMAEQIVMASNNAFFKTVCLRPHLIWGPGDNQLLPKLVEKAKQGRLRIIGDGSNKVDCIFIDNAAKAHVLALDQIIRDSSKVEGKAYFISQGHPIAIAELINQLLNAAELPPVSKHLSPGITRVLARTLESIYHLFGIASEPMITSFLSQELITSHWYDISAAKHDFGYQADVSIETGMEQLKHWLSTEKSENIFPKSRGF
jgi:2-alkyl-3-oxoalkanoate reductase